MADPYERSDDRREDDARRGYDAPGSYRRPSEQAQFGRGGDPGAYDRYDRPAGRPADHMSMEDEAARLRGGIERGWRRLSDGVRRAFEEERPGGHDPRHGGGMFGGDDRPGSLFRHDDWSAGLGPRPTGPHRGKGPSGYARSDARILEDINDHLTEDSRLDASDIEVKVEAGEVTLNGHVSSRPDKRRAEDLAEQVSGVKHLQNNLRVRSLEPSPQPAAGPTVQPSAEPPLTPPGARSN